MIPIQNIYHMLTYAFSTLNDSGYRDVGTESFDNIYNLYASLLIKGVSIQLKRGLNKQYITKTDSLSTLRDRIDISTSIATQSMQRKKLVCTYDDFSENNPLNRILKSTMMLLLRTDIEKARKKELRKLLVFFNNVDPVDIHNVDWNIRYNRNNKSYQLLLYICRMVINGLLQTNDDGNARLMEHMDEQSMHRLYEKFILEYYRKEHPDIHANASQIPWDLDDGYKDMLPIMQSDIMLSKDDRVLIIDAKYYSHTTQSRHEVHTIHSGNLYQVYTYVKNKEAQFKGRACIVSGMLLYARTDESVQPDHVYSMGGNRITVKTLDLNREFSAIKEQLDRIKSIHFD